MAFLGTLLGRSLLSWSCLSSSFARPEHQQTHQKTLAAHGAGARVGASTICGSSDDSDDAPLMYKDGGDQHVADGNGPAPAPSTLWESISHLGSSRESDLPTSMLVVSQRTQLVTCCGLAGRGQAGSSKTPLECGKRRTRSSTAESARARPRNLRPTTGQWFIQPLWPVTMSL